MQPHDVVHRRRRGAGTRSRSVREVLAASGGSLPATHSARRSTWTSASRSRLRSARLVVAGADRRVAVDRDLERADREGARSRAEACGALGIPGPEAARRQAQRGMAHGAEDTVPGSPRTICVMTRPAQGGEQRRASTAPPGSAIAPDAAGAAPAATPDGRRRAATRRRGARAPSWSPTPAGCCSWCWPRSTSGSGCSRSRRSPAGPRPSRSLWWRRRSSRSGHAGRVAAVDRRARDRGSRWSSTGPGRGSRAASWARRVRRRALRAHRAASRSRRGGRRGDPRPLSARRASTAPRFGYCAAERGSGPRAVEDGS